MSDKLNLSTTRPGLLPQNLGKEEVATGIPFQILVSFASSEDGKQRTEIFSKLAHELESGKNLKQAFQHLNSTQQDVLREAIGKTPLAELLSLSQEGDKELLDESLLHFGIRLKSRGEFEKASVVLGLLGGGAAPLPPFGHPLPGGERAIAENLQRKAAEEYNSIVGKGDIGKRLEVLTSRLARDACDWRMIVPMIGASALGATVASSVLGRLVSNPTAGVFTRGIGARFSAGAVGYLAEFPAFAALGRATAKNSEGRFAEDLERSALAIGALKVFGAIGNQGLKKLHGFNAMGMATRFQSALPTTQFLIPQSSIFFGLLASHKLEEEFNLRPHVDGATFVTDTLASMFTMSVGSHLGHRVLGEGFQRFQRELHLRSEMMEKDPVIARSAATKQSRDCFASLAMTNVPRSNIEHRTSNIATVGASLRLAPLRAIAQEDSTFQSRATVVRAGLEPAPTREGELALMAGLGTGLATLFGTHWANAVWNSAASDPSNFFLKTAALALPAVVGMAMRKKGRSGVPPPPFKLIDAKTERALLKKIQQSKFTDRGAIDELFNAHYRLVLGIARKYQMKSDQRMDLIHEGHLGLFEAMRRFDLGRKNRFSNYAGFWIRLYMLSFIVRNSGIVQIGPAAFWKRRQGGDQPGDYRLDAVPPYIQEKLLVKQNLSPHAMGLDEEVYQREISQALPEILEVFLKPLGRRDRAVFEQRIIPRLAEEEPISQEEIGRQFGVSRVRIHQLEDDLLNRFTLHLYNNGLGEILDPPSTLPRLNPKKEDDDGGNKGGGAAGPMALMASIGTGLATLLGTHWADAAWDSAASDPSNFFLKAAGLAIPLVVGMAMARQRASDKNDVQSTKINSPTLEQQKLYEEALKIEERLGDSNEGVRAYAVQALGEIIPHLEPKDRLARALTIEGWLGDKKWDVRSSAVQALSENIPHLEPKDHLASALKIEERRGDSNEGVRASAIQVLGKIIPHLEPKDRLARVLKIEERLGDKNWRVHTYAFVVLGDIISHLEPKDRLARALKIEEWVGGDKERLWDSNEGVRASAVQALSEIIPHLEPMDRIAHVLKIEERLWDKYWDVHSSAVRALSKIIPHLEPKDRLALLAKTVSSSGVTDASAPLITMLLQGLPEGALSGYARASERTDLLQLARYHEAHLPIDPYFYKKYLKASDPKQYLKQSSAELEEYRRGKKISSADAHELHLAYAGLDSPQKLSFKDFEEKLEKTDIPPPFLKSLFQAPVKEVRSLHHLIDKGKITQALAPLEAVKDAVGFKKYLTDLIQKENGALKSIKEDLRAAFPEGIEALKMEEILEGAWKLLPKIYAKRRVPAIQHLTLQLALMLAWHREGIDTLQQKMAAMRGQKIPSDMVWEGLKATEEFYRDTLNDVFQKLKIDGNEIPSLKKQRKLLAAELNRVQKDFGEETTVEFIPSKGQADRFFGYVGEDCTKGRGDSIEREDFQVYRMIANGQLSGMLYLQKAELDGKKVLVMAIQPRSFWEVDQKSLLQVIEENFGRMAEEQGYDAVLLMNNGGQQSNRQDMLKAIGERGYPPIEFKKGISGTVFEGNKFLVMGERKAEDRSLMTEVGANGVRPENGGEGNPGAGPTALMAAIGTGLAAFFGTHWANAAWESAASDPSNFLLKAAALAIPAVVGMAMSKYKPIDAETERALLTRIQQSHFTDRQAVNDLFRAHSPLVLSIAGQYRVGPNAFRDLVQEGYLGLVKAMHRYDPSFDNRFSTYAGWWIRSFMLDFIVRNSGITKISANAFWKGPRIENQFRMANDEESMATQEAVARIAQRSSDYHLDAVSMRIRGKLLNQNLPPARMGLDEEIFQKKISIALPEILESFVRNLQPSYRVIFEQRIMPMLAEEKPDTLREVGAQLGLSHETVRQLEEVVLNLLTLHLYNNGLGDVLDPPSYLPRLGVKQEDDGGGD